jgi:Domain of unknown function (DUF4381)
MRMMALTLRIARGRARAAPGGGAFTYGVLVPMARGVGASACGVLAWTARGVGTSACGVLGRMARGVLAPTAPGRGTLARSVLAAAALAGTALAQADDDIRDIRGPKSVLTQSQWTSAVIAGAIFIVALAAFVVWRQRRRARGPRPRILTLLEQTLQRLEETKPLMRADSAREFGIAASEVIRNYIEKRFNVSATQRTTEEFLQTLLQGSNDALSSHRALLGEFLQQCDFIKFAGTSLAAADLESLFQSARGFVLETSELPAA